MQLSVYPRSIAFIPDGNARWAKENKKSIGEGHSYGIANLKKILNHCRKLGIYCISVYGFSAENWSRPKEETENFFQITQQFLQTHFEEILQKETKFAVVGNIELLPKSLQKVIQDLMQKSQNNKKHLLQVCINYGSRQEIVRACNLWIQNESLQNKGFGEMTSCDLEKHLYTNSQNDPDLLIRTGGTMRLSNFLLYQLSYTELYFSSLLWPDFDETALDTALAEFATRDRRFGGRT